MKVSMKQTDNHAKMMALRAIESPVTQQVIRETIERYLKDTGFDEDVKFDPCISDWKPGKFTVSVYISSDKCYEWLMNQPTTAISTNIRSHFTKRIVFVSHEYTECEITFSINCKLPEEDFKTLDMLGKVHREYKPGYMEQSVFCEI